MMSDREWANALIINGHVPVLNELGEIEMWVLNEQHHNGPGCAQCQEMWCEHCLEPSDVGPCQGERAPASTLTALLKQ